VFLVRCCLLQDLRDAFLNLFCGFSPDEITKFDSPALVDYVLEATNSSSLSYVGHSRGCAMAFLLMSDRPEYNKKIHLLQLLAPVVYTSSASSIIYYLAGKPSSLLSTSSFQVPKVTSPVVVGPDVSKGQPRWCS